MSLSEVTSCQFGVWETIQLHRSYCNRLHLRTCPYTCTAVAMPSCLTIVLFMLFGYLHARTLITPGVWCLPCCSQYEVSTLVQASSHQCEAPLQRNENAKDRYACKISDLGSNVCVNVFIFGLFIVMFFISFLSIKHARHSACFRLWGPFNLSGC